MKFFLYLLFALLIPGASASAQNYDLIVRNGRIIDGTGNPAYFADIAVKEGRIAAIGKISGSAVQELDAEGLVVAPGFIDVHTHVGKYPEASPG